MSIVSYEFKLLSGDIIPVSFTYIPNNIENFRLCFVKECRSIFPDIMYDQLIIFDKEGNIYDYRDIKDNDYVFNVFINDRETVMDIFKKELDEYKKWKGEKFMTYIINIQKQITDDKIKVTKLKVTSVYCGAANNIFFSFFFDNLRQLRARANDIEDRWEFFNDKARYRYFFETGFTEL